jgi:hypothetical protein
VDPIHLSAILQFCNSAIGNKVYSLPFSRRNRYGEAQEEGRTSRSKESSAQTEDGAEGRSSQEDLSQVLTIVEDCTQTSEETVIAATGARRSSAHSGYGR